MRCGIEIFLVRDMFDFSTCSLFCSFLNCSRARELIRDLMFSEHKRSRKSSR
jgi:hypothetical protein